MTDNGEHELNGEGPETLLEAVNRLTTTVAVLTEKLTVSERQRRRLRNVIGAVVLVFVLMVASAGLEWNRITDAVGQEASNAVQQCENANDSRAASFALWDFVLKQSEKKADAKTEHSLELLRSWVAVLYQPHDCNDLSKVYQIPPPPVLG